MRSELLAAEEKATALEAQQAKSVDELEQQFRQEVETLQEYLKSQEKEYIAEIERTRVGDLLRISQLNYVYATCQNKFRLKFFNLS